MLENVVVMLFSFVVCLACVFNCVVVDFRWCSRSCIQRLQYSNALRALTYRSGLFHPLAILHRRLLDTLNAFEWLEVGQAFGHNTHALVSIFHNAGVAL